MQLRADVSSTANGKHRIRDSSVENIMINEFVLLRRSQSCNPSEGAQGHLEGTEKVLWD